MSMGQQKRAHSRRSNRWEGYYLEDCECIYCKHYEGKKRGCPLEYCCCEDEKLDAIRHGRIKRKKGWDKCLE